MLAGGKEKFIIWNKRKEKNIKKNYLKTLLRIILMAGKMIMHLINFLTD